MDRNMRKLNDAQLVQALTVFTAIIKGWSTCSKADLDLKVEKAWAEIARLKAEGGPWKKAKSDAEPVMKRWQALGGLPQTLKETV